MKIWNYPLQLSEAFFWESGSQHSRLLIIQSTITNSSFPPPPASLPLLCVWTNHSSLHLLSCSVTRAAALQRGSATSDENKYIIQPTLS